MGKYLWVNIFNNAPPKHKRSLHFNIFLFKFMRLKALIHTVVCLFECKLKIHKQSTHVNGLFMRHNDNTDFK